MEGLAQSVPGTLMELGLDIHTVLSGVAEARAKLPALVVTVIRLWPQRDHLAGQLIVPADDFDICTREVERIVAVHAAAGHSFLIYVALGGIGGGNHEVVESLRAWKAHHADVRRHGAAALRRLRAAAARALAFADAVRAAWDFAPWSPDWVAWMAAAMRLERLARVSGKMAHCDLRRMRRAIAREFQDVWTVLHPADQGV